MAINLNTYLAYGVRIAAPFAIDDLPLSTGNPDVIIRESEITDHMVDEILGDARSFRNPGAEFRFSPDAMFARWDRVGKVLVLNGNEVIIEREHGVTEDDLGPFLTGPVLSALLHQREFFVLHASCVSINGAAVVFVGHKGHGKSTLAAHLKARGHRLISDDIVPLSAGDEQIRIEPGFPRIKLHDDSLMAIGANPKDYPTIHRYATKRSFQVTEASDSAAIPLRAIYILHEGSQLQITPLEKAHAFIEIMANVHLGRFLEDTDCQSKYFEMCRDITQSVPVFRLDRQSSFGEMPLLLDRLESHTSQIAEETGTSTNGHSKLTSIDLR